MTHAPTEALVRDIVGAQTVAVDQAGFGLQTLDQHGFIQRLHAGCPAISRSQQEVAVAADEVHRDLGRGEAREGSGNAIGQGVCAVVTDPDLEQIAENVKGAGPARRAAQEIQQERAGLRPPDLQVEVGDQIDRGWLVQAVTR